MMREIKLRLVLDGENIVYGDFWSIHRPLGRARFTGINQWTGLIDKNGKEIYEGDIILVSGWIRETIIFESGAFGYYPDGDIISNFVPLGLNYHYDWVDGKSERIEVIGNIYQNSDLLKKEE